MADKITLVGVSQEDLELTGELAGTGLDKTQVAAGIVRGSELVGQNLATQSDLDALVLSSGNLTEAQIATLGNLDGLEASGSEIDATINIISQNINTIENGYLNFLDFVTDEADKEKIITSATLQDGVAMSTYFNNFFDYIIANDIKVAVFPSGTYRPNKITVNGLRDVTFICYGATFYWKSGNATLELDNSLRVNFYGGLWTTTYDAPYDDRGHIRIDLLSGFIKFFNTTFSKYTKSAVIAQNFIGGASSEGVDFINCIFYDAKNYDEVLQTSVTFGEDAEYSRIIGCTFKAVPAAVRFVNGANCMFKDNICLAITGKETDSLYENGVVFADSSGTNNGKLDIIGNKINHISSGIIPIVIKGSNVLSTACRIKDNDMLINGSTTQGTAIYVESSAGTLIKDNKLAGTSTGGSELSSGIIIKDSAKVVIEDTSSRLYNIGISLIDNSTDVYIGRQLLDTVTTPIFIDGTSSQL